MMTVTRLRLPGVEEKVGLDLQRFAKRGDANRVNRIDFAIGAAMVLTFGVLIALALRGSLI